jgi:hypothetical protein
MTGAVACDSCGALFQEIHVRHRTKECPVCDNQGRKVTYTNGETARQDWFSTVQLGGEL